MATKRKILETIVDEINIWFDEQAKSITEEVRTKLDEFYERQDSLTPDERAEQHEYGDCRCCGGSGTVYDDGEYSESCWECNGSGFQTDKQDTDNVQREVGQHEQ